MNKKSSVTKRVRDNKWTGKKRVVAMKAVWWSRNASKIIIGVEVSRVMQNFGRKRKKSAEHVGGRYKRMKGKEVVERGWEKGNLAFLKFLHDANVPLY